MDVETRFELIKRVGEEIITEEELWRLLEMKDHPIAYDGFEPSGITHLAFGIYRAMNVEDLLKAGVKFKLWLADWFAWINNKMGGDLEKIRLIEEYFTEVWNASGVDVDEVEVLRASENMDREHWKRVILIAKNTTLTRMFRCLTILGRKKGELQETSQLFCPAMQVSDIFQLECDMSVGAGSEASEHPSKGGWAEDRPTEAGLCPRSHFDGPRGFAETSGLRCQQGLGCDD